MQIGEESESETETGEDSCAELIWEDPNSETLQIDAAEQTLSMPRYTEVRGSIRMWAPGVTDLSFLECLEVVGGLSISGDDLESLHGLERLRLLTGISNLGGPNSYFPLHISGNPKLRTLEGLSSLEVSPGNLDIERNPMLESLAGLSSLREAEFITIQDNASLTAVDFPSLETFDQMDVGWLECEERGELLETPLPAGNPSLLSIDLPSLQSYTWLFIQGNPLLNSIESLHGPIGQIVHIELNESLPYEQVEAMIPYIDGPIENVFHRCGNLGDPTTCICEEMPPGP